MFLLSPKKRKEGKKHFHQPPPSWTVVTWHEHLRFWRIHQRKPPSSHTVSAILRPWRGRINWRHLPRTLLLMRKNDTVTSNTKKKRWSPQPWGLPFSFCILGPKPWNSRFGPSCQVSKTFLVSSVFLGILVLSHSISQKQSCTWKSFDLRHLGFCTKSPLSEGSEIE